MTDKIGDKKVKSVISTTQTREVQGAEGVSGVTQVKAASGVGAIKGPGGIGGRRATRTMTLAEREQLFSLVNEEAKKLFGESPQGKIIEKAVKMTIDSALEEEKEEQDKGQEPPKP